MTAGLHSEAAEQSVLGAILQWPERWPDAADIIGPESFFDHRHRVIWESVADLRDAAISVDAVSVFERLQANGRADAEMLPYLNALADSVPTADNVTTHARIVLQHWQRRALARAASDAQAATLDPQGRTVEQIAQGLQETLRRIAAASAKRSGSPDDPPLRHITADLLDTSERVFEDELVEGFIGKATLAVLYGDSNSGKTFLAVDMAACIERSAQWMGRNVDGGLVLYLATEACASVELRAAAYRKRNAAELPGLVIVQSPINLFDDRADVSKVVALAQYLEHKTGRKVALVIGDTLARISAGANENSGEDMGVVMRNADAIREALSATFLWIHHVGKDAARGMRGWSGMRALIDTEIEVTADDATGQRCAEVTKQRDLPGKGQRIGFRLEPVPMGRNKWGTGRTSAIVVGTDAPPKTACGKRPSEIAGAVAEFLTARGTGCKKGALVKHFEGRYTSSAVYRELKRMLGDGMLNEVAGIVAMPGKPGGAN